MAREEREHRVADEVDEACREREMGRGWHIYNGFYRLPTVNMTSPTAGRACKTSAPPLAEAPRELRAVAREQPGRAHDPHELIPLVLSC